MTTWPQLQHNLARDLPALDELDTIIWKAHGRCVQLQQTRLSLGLAVVSNEYLPADVHLTPGEEHQLTTWGWQPPDPGDLNWHLELPWPITTTQAAEAADLLVRTMQLVLRTDTPESIDTNRTTSWISDPRRRRQLAE